MFQKLLEKIAAVLASRRFLIFVLVFFAVESAWIAFSALYPQAFDENFHFGLIKVYSHHWLPFLSGQPPHADAYGAVARDPSYLYHYLMSFPYRLVALFVHGQAGQVIALRLMDVAMVGAGLVLFRRVMLRAGVSRALANVSLFIFVLIPIVPQLAAQVSYDDLLFLVTAWLCLQTFDIIDQLKRKRVSARSLFVLAITAVLSALVKYAFLPVLAAIALFLVVMTLKLYRHRLKSLWRMVSSDFLAQPTWAKILLPALLVLSLGMFAQRDVVNLVNYHSVVPDCSKVLSVRECKAYSPWYVDYQRHQKVLSGEWSASKSLPVYAHDWVYWMWYRLFFAVNGPSSRFANYPPLVVPSMTAAAIAAAGGLALIGWRRRIFRDNPYMLFLLTVCAIYLLALFAKGYATYRYTAILENMNGRYLLPVLLPMAAMAGVGLSLALKGSKSLRSVLAVLAIILLLQGGGVLTFMVRSDETWYWHDDRVVKVNDTARRFARHVVVHTN